MRSILAFLSRSLFLHAVLAFTRPSYADPKLKEELDRLMTKYLPPIIPVPGGVYIVFPRAYAMIRNIGKSDEQDLRHARQRLITGSFCPF